ncbi:MAG: S41 family peptidase [Candidatus Limnocylindria bacterium]
MRRIVALSVALLMLVAACAGPLAQGTPRPAPTGDIRRAKLDIAYSAISDNDVHRVSSKKLLEAALDAVKAEARASGGKDDVPTPEFEDVSEFIFADFKKFAEAAGVLAAKNPQLTADRIADAAINAMVRATPDCHTYYVNRKGGQAPSGGVPAALPAPVEAAPAQTDEAGLQFRMIGGNVGYVTWREFVATGTYSITNEVKKVLDRLLAQGAKAWLFDLRGNIGGDPPQTMTSWFLDGEPIMTIQTRNGPAGTVTAKKEFRLPAAYQLPIAIILNRRGGSSPEVFAMGLKENKRATIVGEKSVGCLGATNPVVLPDDTRIAVTVQEFVGAVTGTKYNNVGIPPDIPADDSSAIDVATKHLQEQIAKSRAP